MITRTANRKLLKVAILIIAVLIIGIYGAWRSLNYVKGPSIIISYPPNGIATSSQEISVTGFSQRTSKISLNGRPISVDENGHFIESIILFPGINIITFEAEDQFGRHIKNELTLLGQF